VAPPLTTTTMFRSVLPRGLRAASQVVARRTAGFKVPARGMADVPIHPGPTGPDKRLVLAYSGGLDTSTQLRWLADKGYEVIAFCANLGQGGGMNDEDFSGIEAKALASGAKKCYVLDLQVAGDGD
jgi:tRNA(Ile)-lysidine synthase TilS/MesJ